MPDLKIKLVYDSKPNEIAFFKHFLAGALSGGIARTATAPLDRIKVMSQVGGRTIYPMEGVKVMLKEGGFFSMWRGNGANALGVVPEVAIKFALYHQLKKTMADRRQRLDQPLMIRDRALSAALAGAVAHTLIHPLSVIKTRLVIRKTGEPRGIPNVIRRGYQLHGWKFFYKGFFTAVSGVFVFSAIDLTTYEYFRRLYKKTHDNMSLWVVMACGAVSSILALVTVYPVFLSSTYLQASDERLNVVMYIERIKRKGLQRLYSGLPAGLLKGLPAMVIAYTVYESVLEMLGEEMI